MEVKIVLFVELSLIMSIEHREQMHKIKVKTTKTRIIIEVSSILDLVDGCLIFQLE